jgi:hypothetical protein
MDGDPQSRTPGACPPNFRFEFNLPADSADSEPEGVPFTEGSTLLRGFLAVK